MSSLGDILREPTIGSRAWAKIATTTRASPSLAGRVVADVVASSIVDGGRITMPGRESGKTVTSELMGEEVAGRMVASAESGTFGADVAGYAIDQVFGGIWERPGLDRRAKSLVTMAVIVAMRQPNEFSIHMNIALNIGIELKEIEEALIQILPYVGYPAVATALAAASAVIRDRGLDTKPGYSGHRGLL